MPMQPIATNAVVAAFADAAVVVVVAPVVVAVVQFDCSHDWQRTIRFA